MLLCHSSLLYLLLRDHLRHPCLEEEAMRSRCEETEVGDQEQRDNLLTTPMPLQGRWMSRRRNRCARCQCRACKVALASNPPCRHRLVLPRLCSHLLEVDWPGRLQAGSHLFLLEASVSGRTCPLSIRQKVLVRSWQAVDLEMATRQRPVQHPNTALRPMPFRSQEAMQRAPEEEAAVAQR
jgi:hypothetical protein